MASVFLPVSTEVLLETLVMSALPRFSASRKYGFVSIRGFLDMAEY